jgi:hypothetical protein
MSYPQSLIRRRRVRQPLDELLPDGRTVSEAVAERPLTRLPTNIDPETGGIFEQPIQRIQPELATGTPPFVPQDETVVPIRRISTFNPVSTSVTPEMAEQSVPIQRPIQPLVETPELPVVRRLSTPTDLGGGSTYSGVSQEGDALDNSSRPRIVDPLQDVIKRREYDRLNPPKISRGKAIALAALRGFAAGGLGGALGGAAVGAVSPSSVARLRQGELLAQDDQDIDRMMSQQERSARLDALKQRPVYQQQQLGMRQRQLNQQEVNSKRQGILAALRYKPTLDAERDAALIADARSVGVDLDPANYGKQDGIWVEGVWTDKRTGEPIIGRNGKPIVDRTKIPVEYGGYVVSPGTALSAQATEGRDLANRTDRGNQNQYEDERDRANRQWEEDNRRWEDASRAVSELRKAQEELRDKVAKERNPPARQVYDSRTNSIVTVPASEEDKARFREEAQAARKRVELLGGQVQQNYGDFVESDEDGWPTRIKARPKRPEYPSRPAPTTPTRPQIPPTPKPKNDPLGLYQ